MMAVSRASRRLRIAVLVCHTISEPVAGDRGQFDKVFASWLEAAVAQWSAKHPTEDPVNLEFTGWDVVGKEQYPSSLNEIDAIIVTGSTASAYDEEPWVRKLETFIQGQDLCENVVVYE